MRAQAFPKALRLRRRADYVAVQSQGRKYHAELFLLLLVNGGSKQVGVTVSSKVGNAVVRNRVRRWVREYLRAHKHELPDGHAVLVAKAAAAQATHAAVDADVAQVLRRARGGRR